jgi:PAS domain S-box-containing protein
MQSEREKNKILDSIQDGFFSLDREYRFSCINKHAASIVSRKPEKLIGKVIWEVSPEIVGTALEKIYRQAMELQVAQRIEMKGLLTGSWYSIIAFPSAEGIAVYWQDICKQKKTEQELQRQTEELKQKEAEYLDVLDSAFDGSWIVDCVNGTSRCSQLWAKRIGLDQIPEKDRLVYIRSLIHPDDKMTSDEIYNCFKSKKPKFDLEYRIKTIDKGYIWTQNRGKIIYDGTGNPLKVYGVTFDITERKDYELNLLRKEQEREIRLIEEVGENTCDILQRTFAEQTLMESEERFRAYVTASFDLIYCMNPDWSEMYRLYGKGVLSNPERPDKNWFQRYIHPDDQPQLTTAINKAIREKRIFELEHRVLHKGGSLGWSYSRAIPLINAEGEIVEWFGAALDITDRKKTEAALAKSETRYRELIENSPAAIYEIDAQKERFISVNDAVCQLTGYNREELLAMNPLDILDDRSKVAFQARISQWFKGTRPEEDVDYKLIGKDGRIIHVLLNATFTTDENGRSLRATVISQDITARKQVEQLLREKEKRQAFLLKLSDSIMMLTEPIDIQCMAALTLGYHLGVDRAFFGEIVIKEGIEYYSVEHIYHLPSAPLPPGLYPFEDFRKLADENRAGRNIVVYDLETYPLIKEDERLIFRSDNVRSWVSIPLFKYGKFMAAFTVQHTTPRMWTTEEIALMEETAERTWAAMERARAEGALRASENLLSTVLDNSRDGIYMLDLATGCYLFTNQAQAEITGFSENELNNTSFAEMCERVHPEDCDIYVELHKLMAAGYESIYDVEYRWQVKSGTYRWFRSKRKLVRDSDGKPNAIVGITRDITEQKKAEAALIESEKRYRELVKYAPAGIFEVDFRSNRFSSVNDVMCEIVGYSSKELLEMNPLDLLDERSKAIFRMSMSQRSNGEETDNYVDYTVKTKDGRIINASFNVSYTGDENGEPLGAAVIAHDITERKKMEKALSESEEKYRTLFNSIDEGFCIIDVIFDAQGQPYDWQHLEVNPAFARQTGLSNVSGQYISNLLPEIEEYWFGFFGKVAVTGISERFENEMKAINRWFEIYAFKMGGQDSRKVALIFSDITERKKSKKKNQELIEQLRQSDQNKTNFLNMLSHELRNPLASIMMSLSLQYQVSPGGEDDLKARKVMGRQTAHLSRLVDDLLDITRITQNKIILKKERVELKQLVKLAVMDYQAAFTEKDVGLKFESTLDLLYLETDPARLTQIIGNLLHNASKFTSKGDHVLVKVDINESTQEAIITIQDNGIGIKPEILPNLFEPFMQADSTLDRSNGGLGLGLAIVKGMVELHKGSVSAHSEGLGKGTRLTIRLPITAVEAGKKEQGSQTGGLAANSFKILIIDDIPDIAEILSSLLSYLGHKVAVAFNGPEGIAKAREFRPNVVICDIGLPGMNGYEVAGCLRSEKELKDTFLIALSGYAQAEDLERSREAGFNTHLAKPVDLETLQQVLAEVCIV